MPRISKTAATQTGDFLDNAANHVERLASMGVISKDLARKFAFQCDMISDHVARTAGVDPAAIAKQALTGHDIFDEGTLGLDPEIIGEEVDGMIEGDGDEFYMEEEFTQQENRELRERQQAGDLGFQPVASPQRPTPGRQASLEPIQRLAALLTTHLDKGKVASTSTDLRRNMHRTRLVLKNALRDASAMPTEKITRLGNACKNVHAAMNRASSAQDQDKVARMLSLLESMV